MSSTAPTLLLCCFLTTVHAICNMPLEVRVAAAQQWDATVAGVQMRGPRYSSNNLFMNDAIPGTAADRLHNFTLWVQPGQTVATFSVDRFGASTTGLMAAIYYRGSLVTQSGDAGWKVSTVGPDPSWSTTAYTLTPDWADATVCATSPADINAYGQTYADFITDPLLYTTRPQWIAPSGACTGVGSGGAATMFVRVSFNASAGNLTSCPYTDPVDLAMTSSTPLLASNFGVKTAQTKLLTLRVAADDDLDVFVANYTIQGPRSADFGSSPFDWQRFTDVYMNIVPGKYVVAMHVTDYTGNRGIIASVLYQYALMAVSDGLTTWKVTNNSALATAGWNSDVNFDTTGWLDASTSQTCADQLHWGGIQTIMTRWGGCPQWMFYPNCISDAYTTHLYVRFAFDLNNVALRTPPVACLNTTASPVCPAGYYMNNNGLACLQCEIGTYKTASGNGACTSCPIKTSTVNMAATNSSSCQCAAGYGYSGSVCTLCGANTFKSSVGNVACSTCPSNAQCSSSAFTCIAGYTLSGDGQSCVQCPIGTYKSSAGNGQCTPCAVGTTTATNGSTTAASCICQPGFEWNGSTCSSCATNFYKDSIGNTACISCPFNTTCNATSFQCNAGYTINANGMGCDPCWYGTYKSAVGNGLCTSCNSNLTTFGVGNANASSCLCDNGFGFSGTSCTACIAGTYKTGINNATCAACPTDSICNPTYTDCHAGLTLANDGSACVKCAIGYYKDFLGLSACRSCPIGTSTITNGSFSAMQCVCQPGYGWDGIVCSACPLNTYKTGLRNTACVSCPANSQCTSTAFSCSAGYTNANDGLACSICPAGTYKFGTGNGTCTACPRGSTTSASGTTGVDGCLCTAGFTWDGAKCTECAIGSYKTDMGYQSCASCLAGSTTLSNGTISSDGCVCLPGYEWDGFLCRRCSGSQVKTDVGNTACAACPVNAACSTSIFTCNAGYTLSGDGKSCIQCATGYFKDVAGNGQCLQCQNGSTSLQCQSGVYDTVQSVSATQSVISSDTPRPGAEKSAVIVIDNPFSTTTISILSGAFLVALTIVGVLIYKLCNRDRNNRRKPSTSMDERPTILHGHSDSRVSNRNNFSNHSTQSSLFRHGALTDSYSKSSHGTETQMTGTFAGNNTTVLVNNTEFAMPGFLQFQAGRDFRWEKPLAKGGGGEVYLGHGFASKLTEDNNGVIIVKIVAPARSAISIKASQAFDQEIAVMHFLGRHRNISQMLGWCEEPLAILMKYYQLGTLTSFIGARYMTTKGQQLMFSKDICGALQYMHGKGVAHRDIKADNVFIDLDSDGGAVCVLGDFGIANIFSGHAHLVEGFHVVNLNGLTISYSAPEVIRRFRSRDYSADMNAAFQGDIFSLAMIFFLIENRCEPWSVR